jgi:hypothetical protein
MSNKPPQLMRLFERRRLTENEIAMARTVFADEIDWSRIRLWQLPKLNFTAMVPFGRAVLFSRWNAWRDFSQAPLAQQGWFIHELTHVWQAKRGAVLALAKLGALSKDAYTYKQKTGAKLKKYNIERQAEIVRHLFLARAGAPEKSAAPKEWLEEVWAKRSAAP